MKKPKPKKYQCKKCNYTHEGMNDHKTLGLEICGTEFCPNCVRRFLRSAVGEAKFNSRVKKINTIEPEQKSWFPFSL